MILEALVQAMDRRDKVFHVIDDSEDVDEASRRVGQLSGVGVLGSRAVLDLRARRFTRDQRLAIMGRAGLRATSSRRWPILCREVMALGVGGPSDYSAGLGSSEHHIGRTPSELLDVIKEAPASCKTYESAEGAIVEWARVSLKSQRDDMSIRTASISSGKDDTQGWVQAQGRSSAMESLCPCEEGKVIEENHRTPGFREHDHWSSCDRQDHPQRHRDRPAASTTHPIGVTTGFTTSYYLSYIRPLVGVSGSPVKFDPPSFLAMSPAFLGRGWLRQPDTSNT